jgi:hypothetical protein
VKERSPKRKRKRKGIGRGLEGDWKGIGRGLEGDWKIDWRRDWKREEKEDEITCPSLVDQKDLSIYSLSCSQ